MFPAVLKYETLTFTKKLQRKRENEKHLKKRVKIEKNCL